METRLEFSVKLFLKTAWVYRKHCLIIASALLIFSSIVVFLLPKKYMSVATLINVSEESQSLSGASFYQIMGLAKSFDQGYFKFTAIIKSRTFKEQMVESLGPEFFTPKEGWKGSQEELKNYGISYLNQAIKAKINPDQTNVLNVIVVAKDREKAPIIANQVLVDLQKYISKNSLTKAKRLRNYIEENIIETKAAIFEMSKVLADFYKKYAVNPQKAKVEYPLRNELLELSNKNFEEISMDPLLKENYGVLQEKREKLMERLKVIKEIPEQSYFNYLQDEHQILKEINLTLRQQYELAKLEAMRQEPAFQVIDGALGASLAGPNTRQIYLTALVFSLILAILYVILRLFYPHPFSWRKIFQTLF